MTTAQKNKIAKMVELGYTKFRCVGFADVAVYRFENDKLDHVRIFGSNGVQKNIDTYRFNYEPNGSEYKSSKLI